MGRGNFGVVQPSEKIGGSAVVFAAKRVIQSSRCGLLSKYFDNLLLLLLLFWNFRNIRLYQLIACFCSASWLLVSSISVPTRSTVLAAGVNAKVLNSPYDLLQLYVLGLRRMRFQRLSWCEKSLVDRLVDFRFLPFPMRHALT